MALDIVYPIKRGASRIDDLELFWSLRSVAQNLTGVGRIVIFGSRPAYLDVEEVAMPDDGDKALNLNAKYRAMVASDISDPFLLMDDDLFFLRSVSGHPLYYGGSLPALVEEHARRAYGQYMANTLALLRSHGLPERNFQIHQPLLIDKRTLAVAMEMAGKVSCVMGSLYGNINLARFPTQESSYDFRIAHPDQWGPILAGPHMSLGEFYDFRIWDKKAHTLEPVLDVASWLADRFPDPSPWEKSTP